MGEITGKITDALWGLFEDRLLFGKNWLWLALAAFIIALFLFVELFFNLSFKGTLLNPLFRIPSLLGLAGVLVYFLYLMKRPLPKDRFVVAITKFHPVAEDCKDECNKLADRLRETLRKSAKGHKVNIHVKTCKERLDSSEDDDIARARRLGMHRGAHIVVIGKVRKDEGELSFEAKIVNRVLEQHIGGVQDLGAASAQIDLLSFKNERIGRIDEFVRFIIGLAYYDRKDYEKARGIFEPLNIKTAERYFYQGNSYGLDDKLEEKFRHTQALFAYERAVQIRPDKHEAWYNKGVALSGLGKHEEAIKAYDEAIKIKPDKHEAWYNKGIALDDIGKHEEAIKAYDEAIKIKPDLHEAWNNKGNALSGLGKHEEAIKAYDEAIKIKPDDHEAWYNKGIALSGLGKHEEAIKAYDEAFKIKPDKHEAWNNKGNALFALGKHEEAIKAYDEAFKIKPDKHEAWNNKGSALGKLGKHEEAIKAYDEAIKIKPDKHEAHFNRALVYIIIGDKPEALKSLKRALELDKSGEHMAKARAMVEDTSFPYKDDPDFRRLVGLPPLP